jgi:predicted RNase H-like nuclease
VAVELRGGSFVRAWSASTLVSLLADVPAEVLVGLDMPLGLVDTGWRTADGAAAALLGGRRSSVFRVPPRPVLAAANHAAANAACRELTGGGLSVQAWGLRHGVSEADAVRESGRHELFEVHPELVFAGLAGGPLAYGKKSWNGQSIRRALLAGVGVTLPDDLDAAGVVPVDDVLDASAVAWCAHRITLRTASRVPDPPTQHDHRGRPIVIWY